MDPRPILRSQTGAAPLCAGASICCRPLSRHDCPIRITCAAPGVRGDTCNAHCDCRGLVPWVHSDRKFATEAHCVRARPASLRRVHTWMRTSDGFHARPSLTIIHQPAAHSAGALWNRVASCCTPIRVKLLRRKNRGGPHERGTRRYAEVHAQIARIPSLSPRGPPPPFFLGTLRGILHEDSMKILRLPLRQAILCKPQEEATRRRLEQSYFGLRRRATAHQE